MRIKQNPNKEIVADIRQRLEENDGYCPCTIEQTPETRCMCKEFRDFIEKGGVGSCHCGLYISEQE